MLEPVRDNGKVVIIVLGQIDNLCHLRVSVFDGNILIVQDSFIVLVLCEWWIYRLFQVIDGLLDVLLDIVLLFRDKGRIDAYI